MSATEFQRKRERIFGSRTRSKRSWQNPESPLVIVIDRNKFINRLIERFPLRFVVKSTRTAVDQVQQTMD